MRHPLRSLLLASCGAALSAFGIVAVHDTWVDRDDASWDTAAWKCAVMSPGQVPAPWRTAMLERREAEFLSEVTSTAPDRFEVAGLVERQRPDGSWERRRCTWTLWREEFDDWRLVELAIEGEPACRLDVAD